MVVLLLLGNFVCLDGFSVSLGFCLCFSFFVFLIAIVN